MRKPHRAQGDEQLVPGNVVCALLRKSVPHQMLCSSKVGECGLVVKRLGVLSKVQMLNLVLGVGVFSLLPTQGSSLVRRSNNLRQCCTLSFLSLVFLLLGISVAFLICMQTGSIVRGDAQKSPLLWRFRKVFDFLRRACSLGI